MYMPFTNTHHHHHHHHVQNKTWKYISVKAFRENNWFGYICRYHTYIKSKMKEQEKSYLLIWTCFIYIRKYDILKIHTSNKVFRTYTHTVCTLTENRDMLNRDWCPEVENEFSSSWLNSFFFFLCDLDVQKICVKLKV